MEFKGAAFLYVLAALMISLAVFSALAADPGEAWFTDTATPGVPPEGVDWLPSGSLCPLLKGELAEAVKALESKSFEALDLKSLAAYGGPGCKGRYGQLPYLVRAVSTAGEGRLDAGLLHGEVWMRFAGLGGRDPFEKTPVVLWLYAAPSRVHISASIVE